MLNNSKNNKNLNKMEEVDGFCYGGEVIGHGAFAVVYKGRHKEVIFFFIFLLGKLGLYKILGFFPIVFLLEILYRFTGGSKFIDI